MVSDQERREGQIAFAGLITGARQRARWTQAELAKRAGVDEAFVGRLEDCTQPVDADEAWALCQALGLGRKYVALALGYVGIHDLVRPTAATTVERVFATLGRPAPAPLANDELAAFEREMAEADAAVERRYRGPHATGRRNVA